MPKNKITLLPLPEFFSVQAELWSADKSKVFRITFYDFENSKEDWLKTKIEYQSKNIAFEDRSWEFDGLFLEQAHQLLLKFNGTVIGNQCILNAPYSSKQLSLTYKTVSVKKTRRNREGQIVHFLFNKNHEGLFLKGDFIQFKFEFKVKRADLIMFQREIKKAYMLFPHRNEYANKYKR